MSDFKAAQKLDPTLEPCSVAVEQSVNSDARIRFYFDKDLLYREYKPKSFPEGCESVKQLVVPKEYRDEVLDLAYTSVFAGHFGIKKTLDKVTRYFNWPHIRDDFKIF